MPFLSPSPKRANLLTSALKTARDKNSRNKTLAANAFLQRKLHATSSGRMATVIEPTFKQGAHRLLLLGSPGAGKGTQAARIQKNFPFIAISSGDILRKNIDSGTNIGKIAQEIINKGGMVPDHIMVELINNELKQLTSKSWLLDGFPRSVDQAQNLDASLGRNEQPLDLVLNLHVPQSILLERILDRWVHVPSGRVYNTQYNPPKVKGIDDVTGQPLSRRPDDDPEIFKVRLQKHDALMQPLLEYYDKKSILVTVSGNSSDEIYPQIEAELMKRYLLKGTAQVG